MLFTEVFKATEWEWADLMNTISQKDSPSVTAVLAST